MTGHRAHPPTEAEIDYVCGMVAKLCAHVLLPDVTPPEPKAEPMRGVPNHILFVDSEPWMAAAECAGMDAELFYGGRGENVAVKNAKAVCAACIVRDQCLDYAMRAHEMFGIWGGKSERERRRMRRRASTRDTRPMAEQWGNLSNVWTLRSVVVQRMLEDRHPGRDDLTKLERDAVRATLRYALDSGQAEAELDADGRWWLRLTASEAVA